jgi:hypothetical protein
MTNQHSVPPDVIAVFPTIDDARKAIASLERAGIDGSKVSLVGRKADEAADRAAVQEDVSSRDSQVAGDVTKSAVTGSAVGGAAGLLAGLAAFAIPGVGPVVGAGIWLAALGGAVGGAGVGGVVGGVSALPMSPDWELASESLQHGRSVVAVHAENPDEIAKAEKVLHDSGAIRVEMVGGKKPRKEAA